MQVSLCFGSSGNIHFNPSVWLLLLTPWSTSHLNSRDTTFAMVSRAPIAKIEAFKKRMGWEMPWYSSFGEPFNYDFHVTQDEDIQPIEYNFDDKATMERKGLVWAMQGEQPVSRGKLQSPFRSSRTVHKSSCPSVLLTFELTQGMSVFLNNDEKVYHTYSSYGRGGEVLLNTYSLLDATPVRILEAIYL